MHSKSAIATAAEYVRAPLVYKGKVREMYDLGEHFLLVVTDRISAFDYVLKPAVPEKGNVLNLMSSFWFRKTADFQPNHMVHTDVEKLGDAVTNKDILRDRVMVVRKTKRIDIECVVRGYITGGGWRQYQKSGAVNGINLAEGLRKNQKLERPLFTPAAKNDKGHDEEISFEQMRGMIGAELAVQLREKSVKLYEFAHEFCLQKDIILADSKFEFGLLDGKVILIDELFTPDSSRFWARQNYGLDTEIDSMDKEPVRTYLTGSDWDKNSEPKELPARIVEETSNRYREILRLITN